MTTPRDSADPALSLTGLPPDMSAGLLLILKRECEEQHARADRAESKLAGLRELVEKWRIEDSAHERAHGSTQRKLEQRTLELDAALRAATEAK